MIKCEKCGEENKQDAKFCNGCGAAIRRAKKIDEEKTYGAEVTCPAQPEMPFAAEVPETPATGEKGQKKTWIVILAAALAVIVVLAVFLMFGNCSGSQGTGVHHYYETIRSFDGKTKVYKEGSDLYLRVQDEEIRIAENAGYAAANRVMAGSGNALIYEKDEALYRYDRKSGQASKVADAYEMAAISTNGEYVAYSKDDGLYLWDGESKKLYDADSMSFSVSDDGLVYSYGQGGSINLGSAQEPMYCAIYSFTKDGTQTMVKDGVIDDNIAYDFIKNRTQDQILFLAYDGPGMPNLYVSVDGKPAQRILENVGPYPEPVFALGMLSGAYNGLYSGTVDVGQLCGQIYATRMPMEEQLGEMALVYVDENWKAKVLLGYSAYEMNMIYERTTNDQYIYANYRMEEDRSLYRIDVATGAVEKLLEDVAWFHSAGDGSVYYSDADENLLHLKDGKTEQIAQKIGKGNYVGTADGGVLYCAADGKLWWKRPGEAERMIAEDVRSVRHSGREYYYVLDDGRQLYSTDAEHFALPET